MEELVEGLQVSFKCGGGSYPPLPLPLPPPPPLPPPSQPPPSPRTRANHSANEGRGRHDLRIDRFFEKEKNVTMRIKKVKQSAKMKAHCAPRHRQRYFQPRSPRLYVIVVVRGGKKGGRNEWEGESVNEASRSDDDDDGDDDDDDEDDEDEDEWPKLAPRKENVAVVTDYGDGDGDEDEDGGSGWW
uniref:Uncharacterized protein n=1 Tax=Vespula pensylvanica TaxID=30213 RepID=A0A834NBN0_VESPE|nr:hypothetical protein H0235_015550 [Vespula pensylvanica]